MSPHPADLLVKLKKAMGEEPEEDEGRWLSLELILSCKATDRDGLEYYDLREL
ncbi:MAG: hypothetical protein ACE5Z5_09825 [Candidatus Bathyarchaeia archaeon]